MKEFLAKKSLFFHLLLLRLGVDLFPNSIESSAGNKLGQTGISEFTERKILIVGMSESPHLHTWVEGIADSEITSKIWLFPSDLPLRKLKNSKIKIIQFPYLIIGLPTKLVFRILDVLTGRLWRSYFLFYEINRIKPTHLHFHETQHSAYIYNAIAKHPKNQFAGKIVLSTWGSDLIAYGKIENHLPKIRQVMSWVGLLTAERSVDEQIAIANGFTGKFLAPIYITIGNRNLSCDLKKPSERSIVVVKGYQDAHGRALNALASIELLAHQMELNNFRFKVFSASKSVKKKSKQLRKRLGINIDVLPRMPKTKLMAYFGEARAYLGLALSDGLSTSMVEAMSYGAFPIQSENSAAPEFLVNKVTGGVVDPEDIQEVSNLLRMALLDDELVDQAALSNAELLKIKYNWETGVTQMAEIYE
jgi:glycosyltransferase involved in cell wall biosynthesis